MSSTPTSNSCDVAIVGGGPAGAFAAWLLARQGARVRLFDPSHPREKPCGGGVTGRALALVAPMLGDGARAYATGVPVRSARFEGPDDRSAAVDLFAHGFTRESSLIVMSRRAFDRALLDGAIAAGAIHDPSRVTDVDATGARGGAGAGAAAGAGAGADAAGRGRSSAGWGAGGSAGGADGVTITAASGTWHARHVIGADGANSFVRRRLGQAFTRRQLSIATGFFAHGVTSPEIVIRFVPQPQGYIWSFPRADHLAVGICAQADESQPGPLRDIVARWIDRAAIAPGASLEPYAWPIPSLAADDFDRDRPAGPGWMLVGDAAGLVDPITREGIFFALRSAQLAVEALAAPGGDPSARYHAALRDEIHPELKRAARVKRNFFRGPFTRLLIDALERSAPVRDIMRDLVAGEQPYRTLRGRLLRTFEVGLAWQLARLQFSHTWKASSASTTR